MEFGAVRYVWFYVISLWCVIVVELPQGRSASRRMLCLCILCGKVAGRKNGLRWWRGGFVNLSSLACGCGCLAFARTQRCRLWRVVLVVRITDLRAHKVCQVGCSCVVCCRCVALVLSCVSVVHCCRQLRQWRLLLRVLLSLCVLWLCWSGRAAGASCGCHGSIWQFLKPTGEWRGAGLVVLVVEFLWWL